MVKKETDIISLLERALAEKPQENLEEVGTVIKVGDGICKIYGLTNAVYGELIEFERGSLGIVLDLDEDYVSVVLLESDISVIEQEVARRTGDVFRIPVGFGLLGRVINSVGKPLDSLGEIKNDDFFPIEKIAPGIVQRVPVNSSLETGITVIDALIPIGKGQRELLIGNRSTGKTSIILDIIKHQKDKNVICIYVSIGHKQANTARIVYQLEKFQAMDYTIIVDADAKETALDQYLAPYSGCAIGEYFMKQGRDVLIIYDDLSKHAIAYRELSLLLRRPPGREAYPGDIFYIHSRLLERAGKISKELGGGSLTAIPIAQTQDEDISAYIPTNLISITDGQIFLDTNLFNNGIRPAVNIGLSVSRVGSAAQSKAIKKVAGALKLEIAQYNELLAFAQFGSELDKASQKALDRGRRAVEILKQNEYETYSFVDQSLFLFLLKENYLDDLDYSKIKAFVLEFASYFKATFKNSYDNILQSGELSDKNILEIRKAIDEFKLIFAN
ncbi:F0F1 ATP synthase subunit alpha [Candidatus Dependentiae bacterium]|nr:F0F1 ATP synthase subunit alpha [Candidatus Dependentiae bacterium]MBU4387695.1 F0F1 ATP synthase subunit alpha [Candidatus Dependentiae bacterium]MCG2756601.1 F0F1 ATP synthase subunit alpha [Candidatus Dependentiae bacterium]